MTAFTCAVTISQASETAMRQEMLLKNTAAPERKTQRPISRSRSVSPVPTCLAAGPTL
jgi:hypothetical protein